MIQFVNPYWVKLLRRGTSIRGRDVFLCAWVVLLVANTSLGQADKVKADHFEKRVRPLLVEHCFKCHSEKEQKGDLRLDSRAGMLAGGESGPAINVGAPDASLLIEAVRHESFEMPPKGKLTDKQIGHLIQWIQDGAVWPGSEHNVIVRKEKITEEDRSFWSFQPVKDFAVPEVKNRSWCRNDIDAFILRKLESEGIAPAPRADRRQLLRRLYLDIIGLPPSPQQMQAFLADNEDGAYARVVDELLDSQHYGEHWGRYWLDLVRYAESDGYRADAFRPEAWRYRDYVIRSFNEDKPYDRFVMEQLAGDELDPDDPDCLVATGYLRHWIYEWNQRDVRTHWAEILNDVTDVTADVFMGMGMGCARCHDHKFDPLLQKDYFQLQAFFTPLLPRDDVPLATPSERDAYERQLATWQEKTSEIRTKMAELEATIRKNSREGATNKFPADIQAMMRTAPADRDPLAHQLAELAGRQITYEAVRLKFAEKLKGQQQEAWKSLSEELKKFDHLKPRPLPKGMTVTDVSGIAPDTLIPSKRQPTVVQPAFLTVLGGEAPASKSVNSGQSTGRRMQLAKWMTDPSNPLTTRVITNRIWQYHFGRGLVSTASDFGSLGQKPSHPGLLDWLTRRFVEDGWSLKKLHRRILLSATYQQSAMREAPEVASQRDPANAWLWRMNARRMTSEQIRDAVLYVTGGLDMKMGGASVAAHQSPRRSVYVKAMRNSKAPMLDVFDMADGISSTAKRNVTTTANQALQMLNGEWALSRAAAWAKQLGAGASDTEVVQRAYGQAFGRAPNDLELQAALQFLGQAEQDAIEIQRAQQESPIIHADFGGAVRVDANNPPLAAANQSHHPQQDFTVEAVIQLESLYADATVRTIVSQWNSNNASPGWAFGVTSTKSAYQPRNLILQLVGKHEDGNRGYEVIASDLRPQLNKPYYVAVSVNLSDTSESGITFYLKDLSAKESAVQTASVKHKCISDFKADVPLVIGGRHGSSRHQWHGLIDEVAVSKSAKVAADLAVHQGSGTNSDLVAKYSFGMDAPLADTSSFRTNLARVRNGGSVVSARTRRIADFCHVLLNSNEFIYID